MVVTTAAQSQSRVVAPSGWDTEVFILNAEDRSDLARRAHSLADRLEQNPDTHLTDIAAGLARDLLAHGPRVAIVSGGVPDLIKKLRRAADRIASANCKHIRDSAGVYFFDEPLFLQGSLALLFPGEGAQYPGMLADLCHVFPEVEETFAWCDQIAAEANRPSLRNVLHPSPDGVAAAEAELRKLGPSIFGVLIADMALIKLLWNLQLPVSAIAGHSAGEIAALLVAGAMDSREVLGPRLSEIMDIMQAQEDTAGGPDITLIAVGAGKAVVDEIAVTVSGGSVIVAMDNCPHQCVAVGPTAVMGGVEKALLGRGLVCERLPFRRPYHTPWFEPWMGPFRELFAPVPFSKPHTPIYSCSTGTKFPDDPSVIRELAVNHWVSPVEFARMIETMYADGVRIFIEVGPRGNLSAFVEDILRGKPFAAIPANVHRKSGPTQINHMTALLAAHHVPMNIAHLYAGRVNAPSLDQEPAHSSNHINVAHTSQLRSPAHPVMNAYLASMEQFLDMQREVMTAFLSNCPASTTIAASHDSASHEHRDTQQLPPIVQDEARPAQCPYCLVGEVIQYEPGQEIVFRRVMDEREDLYADDHTLGGRAVSRTNPNQNGLPVLPMTFSLEAMAQAASLLAPGKVVTVIRNVRLYRWLPFDADPTTLEVRASVSHIDPDTGVVEVRANVRDLGNSFLKNAADKPSSEAVIVLADRYPDPPEPRPFQLTDEVPCRSSVEDLRRNMFHGPLFHMIRSLGRTGKEGIEGTLEVQPRDRWFRSNTDPQVTIDPVLVDAAMHILGAWHLEQPDWTGRILLPIGVQSLEFFGPIPPVGSNLIVRGHNEEETARQARHGVELFDPNGRLWFRMNGASYWRFYLPFGNVNFFGPKDEYFLSREWLEAVPPRGTNEAPRRCYFIDPPVDLAQPVLRAAGARVTMTPHELAEFGSLKGSDADINNWYFTRLLAKDAVRATWKEKYGEGNFPADIETECVAGRIVCRRRDGLPSDPLPRVSIATAKGKVASFAAFAEHVGIALLTLQKGEDDQPIRLEAAKQAVADALQISITELRAESVSQTGLVLVAYAGRQLRVQTARKNDLIVATTLCEAESL